ncbi:MAG TPA: GGDEF domain-containing protein [Candidatus Acidoferrales bacterium]|nr:GGDEF domain-containing protein [Candidatus Acidoferrales bacterium]
MPQPGEPVRPQPSAEDSFLDMLVETLAGLEEGVRGPFLQRFFKTFTQIDLTEAQSLDAWAKVLARQREFSEALGRRVSLKTALVDVLGATHFTRVPVVLEYDEYKKLQSYAATDALTGLYNRRLFDETCERELTRSKRYNQQLAFVIFDLRHLKEVNDQYGHPKGDEVLRLAANNLRKTLRASDFAFRIGGDEFALLLPQTDPEQAATLCRRVRSNFEAEVTPLQMKAGVTLDFGLAVHPRDAETKESLIDVADKQLYALRTATGSSRVIPMEAPASSRPVPRETPAAPSTTIPPIIVPPVSAPASAAATAQAGAAPKQATHPRKWERVSLAGTKSYAVIDGSLRTATVVDLSYGGVALVFDKGDDLPSQFSAVLHVPILPPLRVSLRKAYANSTEGGRVRMGCAFVA